MCCFFFNDTATTEIYTLSLHDALPIFEVVLHPRVVGVLDGQAELASATVHAEADGHGVLRGQPGPGQQLQRHRFVERRLAVVRSEEHTSELQSRQYLVCRLLLEKKKTY